MISTIIAYLMIVIFLVLSCIHFYWAAGGKWGTEGVFPTKDDNDPVLMPGVLATLIVAIGFSVFAIVVFSEIVPFSNLPKWISPVHKYGLWVIAAIFIIRAVGEFNYVGLFKKVKNTPFGKRDTLYYTPLCISIALMAMLLKLNI